MGCGSSKKRNRQNNSAIEQIYDCHVKEFEIEPFSQQADTVDQTRLRNTASSNTSPSDRHGPCKLDSDADAETASFLVQADPGGEAAGDTEQLAREWSSMDLEAVQRLLDFAQWSSDTSAPDHEDHADVPRPAYNQPQPHPVIPPLQQPREADQRRAPPTAPAAAAGGKPRGGWGDGVLGRRDGRCADARLGRTRTA